MKQLLFISIVLLLATSCKKKTTVTIQAQDYITGEATAYAGMDWAVSENWTPVLEAKSKIVASGTLDDNGYANFDLKMNPNRKYVLGVSQPDNICVGGLILESLDHESTNNFTIEYLECGFVSVPFENINCFNSNDKMWFKYYYTENPEFYMYRGYTSGDGSEWSEIAFYSGCGSYSGDLHEKVPEGNFTFEWRVERENGVTSGSDNFSVNKNDTTVYIFDY
ncbi:MAG: hypothetical protein ACI857_000004 [Arenicella sp.]|jgi:hypothetical protein